MSWEEYIERRIIEPLGMTYATGRQPIPADLAAYMSKGYVFEEGRYVEKPFEMVDASAPAGSVSASAEAMAKFMIAHLQHGQLGEARILRDETSRHMQTRQFGHDPRVNGFALGFYEQSSHGLRLVGHGGDTQWFHTDLWLIPSEQVGVFVSTNSVGGGAVSFYPFLEAFLDHYYPVAPVARPEPPQDFAEQAGRYEGTYVLNRRAFTNFEKVLTLMGGEVEVSAGDPGELVVGTPFGTARVFQTERGLFRESEGSMDVVFEEDDAGQVTRLFLGPVPMMVGEKVSFGQRPAVHRFVLGVSLVILGLTIVLMPIRYLVQRSVDGVAPLRGRERGWRWLALAVALLDLGFIVALASVGSDPSSVIEGRSGPIKAVLVLPMLSVLLTLVLAATAVVAWRARLWGRWGRVYYTIVAMASVAFILELSYWNLLGWRM